ncbi:hypothetical protein [Secundilactobacillus malefermentans]|uniref:hypothetical protein n=1 Tax=Secundilactobacillus malefermentans TaxID=176292 RepID=UPI0011C9044E|nr:hypothetical protein [Secundilactobacillus malefermentans]QEA31609.1 hypothetical protein FGL90_05120 [Secundilactobacillus malefermentans]
MKKIIIKQYFIYLLKGIFIMLILQTWSLQKVNNSWVMPITPVTIWNFLSWLLCYPILRKRFAVLFSKDDAGMESYKNKALKLHQQDISNNHKHRQWTSDGVVVNPWAFQYLGTQTTDEIVNPIFVFFEHLWISFLLIILGPIFIVSLMFIKITKYLVKRIHVKSH